MPLKCLIFLNTFFEVFFCDKYPIWREHNDLSLILFEFFSYILSLIYILILSFKKEKILYSIITK